MGGFPAVALTGRKDLLREYFTGILYRDVLPRLETRYPHKVEALATYLLSNVGKPFSYRRLAEYIGVKREVTAERYVHALEKAFLLYTLQQWHPSLRLQRSYGKKAYAVEHGLPSLFPRFQDAGRLFENAVLLQLRHLFPHLNIYYARNGGEVDFLLCEGLKPLLAINATWHLSKANASRELRPLSYWRARGVPSYLIYFSSDIEEEHALPFFALPTIKERL